MHHFSFVTCLLKSSHVTTDKSLTTTTRLIDVEQLGCIFIDLERLKSRTLSFLTLRDGGTRVCMFSSSSCWNRSRFGDKMSTKSRSSPFHQPSASAALIPAIQRLAMHTPSTGAALSPLAYVEPRQLRQKSSNKNGWITESTILLQDRGALACRIVGPEQHAPSVTSQARQYERRCAKERVLAAHRQGKDWKEAAIINNITIDTARRVISRGTTSPQAISGVCDVCVKMTLKATAKLEERSTKTAE
ncbi:hypothetical protein PybrP1_010933 [[Pythium] brassicae (nom. inval.)]|nr:hypothetical protein PybrP1_010933 [[Pythium] brassicae (nom. inval.)]